MNKKLSLQAQTLLPLFFFKHKNVVFNTKQLRDAYSQLSGENIIHLTTVPNFIDNWNNASKSVLSCCSDTRCTLKNKPHVVCCQNNKYFWICPDVYKSLYSDNPIDLLATVAVNQHTNTVKLEKQRRLTIARLRSKIAKTRAVVRDLEFEREQTLQNSKLLLSVK